MFQPGLPTLQFSSSDTASSTSNNERDSYSGKDNDSDDAKSPDQQNALLKVVVLGGANVGKTALIKKYIHNVYSNNYPRTLGVDFALKILRFDDTELHLQFWDVASGELKRDPSRYYKETNIFVFVCDVTNPNSYQAVKAWVKTIQSLLKADPTIVTMLLANKAASQYHPSLSFAATQQLARGCNIPLVSEVEASTGAGIDAAIKQMAASYIQTSGVQLMDSDDVPPALPQQRPSTWVTRLIRAITPRPTPSALMSETEALLPPRVPR